MKLFLDTANLDEIKEIANWGVLSGVTTNPSLVAKEGAVFKERVKEICAVVAGPVSAEVTATNADEMIAQGREIAKWAPNAVVKCPLTPEGLKATARLSSENIRVNVTLCFSANQGLLAARAGASFVSPFIGRLDDINQDGMELIHDLVDIFANYDFATEVLAASIRHPIHVTQAALAGADVATLPYKIFKQLVHHPLTDAGQEKFLADWKKSGLTI